MTDNVRATVYLQVEPEFSGYYADRDTVDAIRGAKVVGSTQRRSRKPKQGTVEVALTIELPKAAFLALRPAALVVIPESLTTPHPIEVEATDPNVDA